MARKGQVIEMTDTNERRNEYVHVNIPAVFLHPHTYTAKDWRTFEKAYVHFPSGTKVNGVSLTGYSCDVFLTDYMKQQMLSGGKVTLSFKPDEPVPIWTGSKDDPERPYKRFEVNPWDLAKGVKKAVEEYAQNKADERAMRQAKDGVSLTNEAEASRDASGALAGDTRTAAAPAR